MSDIEQLEALKLNLIKQVELRDQILRLTNNAEYEAVILKDYFTNEACRCVRIGSDINLDAKQRDDAIQMALATGHLQRYLSANIQMGNAAENQIRQIDADLEELRMEGE